VTAIATQGWGVALAGEIGITSAFAQGCLSGTISGLSSSVVAGTYSHHGNILGALEDTVSSQALRSLAVSALTAGAMGHAKLAQGPDFIDHLKKSTLQAALNTGLKIAIEGADPGAALRQGLLSAGVNTLSGWGASEIGLKRSSLDYTSHKLLHGIVGAVSGQILYKDAFSGALGAVASEVFAEAMQKDGKRRLLELFVEAAEKGPVDPKKVQKTFDQEVEDVKAWARIGASGLALAVGGDVTAAHSTAQNALDHNFAVALALEALPAMALLGTLGVITYEVVKLYQEKGWHQACQKLVQEGYITEVYDEQKGTVYGVKERFVGSLKEAWVLALESVPLLQDMFAALKTMAFPEPQAPLPGFEEHKEGAKSFTTPAADTPTPLPGMEAHTTTTTTTEGFGAYDGQDMRILDRGQLPKDLPAGTWLPPEEALDKVPDSLGMGQTIRKGDGWRWQHKHGENSIRIRKGNPQAVEGAQKVDYVKITSNGKLVDRNGEILPSGSEASLPEVHIPLSEWVKWPDPFGKNSK